MGRRRFDDALECYHTTGPWWSENVPRLMVERVQPGCAICDKNTTHLPPSQVVSQGLVEYCATSAVFLASLSLIKEFAFEGTSNYVCHTLFYFMSVGLVFWC